jgi:hypothetical protein
MAIGVYIGVRDELFVETPHAAWAEGIPTDLTATAISDTEIDLEWVNVDLVGDGVSIERSPTGETFTKIGTVVLGVTTYSDTNLTPETKYYYRVKSYKGHEYSNHSIIVNTITEATP